MYLKQQNFAAAAVDSNRLELSPIFLQEVPHKAGMIVKLLKKEYREVKSVKATNKVSNCYYNTVSPVLHSFFDIAAAGAMQVISVSKSL